MRYFEKFTKKLLSKEKFHSSLTDRKINDKEYGCILIAWNKFEKEKKMIYRTCIENVTFYYEVMCLKNLKIIA